MAVAAQKTVSSLMRKTLERQTAVARVKFKFNPNQVEKILVSYVKDRNVGPYNDLIKVLKDYPLNDGNYKILLEDSLLCVVLLGRELKQYVELVCSVEWASRSEDLVELFSKFVLGLVTAHTYHCPQVMACLMKLFKAEGENWEGSPSPELVFKWSNIHTIIAQVVAIVPIPRQVNISLFLTSFQLMKVYKMVEENFTIASERSSDLLMQTVVDQFPYYKAGCYINRMYVHNLIWMSKYIPLLQEQIITAIISRMVVMDVNIVDQSKNRVPAETLLEMDTDEQDMVTETLDYCMLEMLSWLEVERDPALHILCNVFEKVVLPTYGIRHVQFLIIYTISINQQCADRILNNLWMVAAGLHGLGPGALATRRTAASHLSGLLARCVRVPNTRLIHYLRSMSDWCHSYITATQESSTASDNTKVHGAFHAVCHAIFYLVAFKNHHLFMSKENLNFVESLNLPRLVTCSLNPLRTCPPQVTHAFSSVTRAHQVVYCQAIIEKNARHTLSSARAQEYDEWFPYDPYLLPVSGKIVWPLCIEYKDFLKDSDSESQYKCMKKKLKLEEDDDYLNLPTPAKRIASSLSNTISPGFLTSETVLL